MSPEQEAKLNELYEWMLAKKKQQISKPIDDASLNNILERLTSVTSDGGTSTANLTQVYTDSGTDTHTGPKQPAGKVNIIINGTTYAVYHA